MHYLTHLGIKEEDHRICNVLGTVLGQTLMNIVRQTMEREDSENFIFWNFNFEYLLDKLVNCKN